MATKNRAKGGTMKTNGTKKSAAKAAAKGGVKAAAKRTTKGGVKGAVLRAVESVSRPHTRVQVAPKPSSPGDIGDEAPPSLTSAHPIRRLAWGYALLSQIDDDAMTNLVVDAGTKVAIEGELDRLAYVYVVQIGTEDRSVEVLYPPAGGSRRMRPGARMRIPAGTGWIVTTKKCRVRTVASTYPLTDEQIAALA